MKEEEREEEINKEKEDQEKEAEEKLIRRIALSKMAARWIMAMKNKKG